MGRGSATFSECHRMSGRRARRWRGRSGCGLRSIIQGTRRRASEEVPPISMYTARPQHKNIFIFQANKNVIAFRANLTTERILSDARVLYFNDLNKRTDQTKFYFEIEDSKIVLRGQVLSFGQYSKEVFGEF